VGNHNGMRIRLSGLVLFLSMAVLLLAACGGAPPPTTTPPPTLAQELDLYNWSAYLPQGVLDAFEAEYGVKVNYVVYSTQEEAVASLQAGNAYDVVVMGNEFLPLLIQEGLLAELDYRNVPNYGNISANFRDLTYDPGNKHSIPFNWGTQGLLVRSDLITGTVDSWADLWAPQYAGRVVVWDMPNGMIQVALKSLGYSANSEDPAELEAALGRLRELRASGAIFWPSDEESIIPPLAAGQAVLSWGWAYDAMLARDEGLSVTYVLPTDGTILWGDSLVIPANSPHKYTAEVFLNFVLQPEISAMVVNELYYANANEAARQFIDPAILNDPLVYPPEDTIRNAEIALPLSPAGQRLYDETWQRFLDTQP